MSDKIRDKAMRDSARNDYDPPHSGIGGGWLNNISPKQAAEQKLYKEIWRANRKNIEKQR